VSARYEFDIIRAEDAFRDLSGVRSQEKGVYRAEVAR
jgi:hypothetical protein